MLRAVTADETETLEGTLERVVFQNRESAWTVARIKPEGGGVQVTAVGPLTGVTEGTPLHLTGRWVTDPKYGRQFKVESYRTKSPETVVGIERYLGSGLVPGIGPELAKRIVARFGLDTLEVIEKHPERLTDVEGIGAARIEKIAGAWDAQKEIQDVMVFLRGAGISSAFAARVYKRWGSDAIGLVRENPYRLTEIWGIGFRTADAIAQNMGIPATSPDRLQTGLVHVLITLSEDGHVHVPVDQLRERAAELLTVEADLLDEPLEALVGGDKVVLETLGDRGPCISLKSLWIDETEAARALAELATTPMKRFKIDATRALAELEAELGVELAHQQRRAIEAATADKCVVVTGGPGVGKTTIIRGVVQIFSRQHRAVALAAPTGRAAKRLSESTGREALTLHRLLEYQPQTGGFNRGPDQPLEFDAVIIDEVSMVDIALFHALLIALPPEAQLILVGDIDQLPSVGPGAVLADVIASRAATVVELTEIFRQAAESSIILNAHRINSGELPELSPPPGRDARRSDFYFVDREDPAAARDTVVELVAERIPEKLGFDPMTEIQVLAPMHRGELGTVALNLALQARLNPEHEGVAQLRRGDRAFRDGDKVMQIKNDYDKNVFNGDIGRIVSVSRGDRPIVVEMIDGRRCDYERSELDQLIHAYAVSVHKSQGSEYPAVIIPLVTQHYMMLQRNLLYTGITRGKQLVILVGSQRAVQMAVRNQSTKQRWTWLAERIREATEPP